ncbi:MAG TPA: transglutaminaseTgpA domain-containing protein [Chloroflexia bacterium]|nr:transglutaminaseTgpA domain-containing protein [Chloroflexia bacterium]
MSRILKLQEGWLTVSLLALVLFSVTFSIQQAKWAEGLNILTTITLVGLFTGLVLSKVRGVPRILLDLVGLLMGFLTVMLSVASIIRDPRLSTLQERVRDLLERTVTWINVAVRQDMSDDLVVFILSLAVVCWVLAYSSSYFIFRARQLWWALVPNGVALLINISYAPVDLKAYMIIFMISALLLMIRFNLLVKEERWQSEGVTYSPGLSSTFLWTGSLVAGTLALAMAYVPASSVNSTLNSVWEKINQPWLDFQANMSRLWSQVPGNQAIGGYSAFNKSFTMGGALSLSDATALIVESTERRYWRATTYDEYTGMGWRNTSANTFHVPNLSSMLALEANQELTSKDASRREVSYTVQVVNPKGDIIFASLRPQSLTKQSRLDVSWQWIDADYNIDDLYDPNNEESLSNTPLELRTLFSYLHDAQEELRIERQFTFFDTDARQLLYSTRKGREIRRQEEELNRRGVNVYFSMAPIVADLPLDQQEGLSVHVSGEFPVYDDISSLHAIEPLARNEQYTVVSLFSDATDEELRAAPFGLPAYEQWLIDRYLKLPASISQRVRNLAAEIVQNAGATNPYDQAKAIETYLRENYKYNTQIAQPEPGVDRADWFLFEGKEGYCEYYSTAMVVMLRTLKVPARVATGYAPGDYDSATHTFTVKESAAHAWPEVYFPGYGWIEFEPTPSQAVITHDPLTGTDGGLPTPEPTVDASTPTPVIDDNERPKPATPTPVGATGAGTTGGSGGWTAPIILGAVVVLGGLVIFLSYRRRRTPSTASSYYGKMLSWARWLRIRPVAHQTPYEFTESLAREVPGTSLLARRITRAYVKERYSRPADDLSERSNADSAWRSLKPRLLRYVPVRQLRLSRRRRRRHE